VIRVGRFYVRFPKLLSAEFAGSRLRQVSRIRAAFTRALCKMAGRVFVRRTQSCLPEDGSDLRLSHGARRLESSLETQVAGTVDDLPRFGLQGVQLVFVQDLPALRSLDGRSKKTVYVEISFDCARVRPIRTLIGGSCLQRRFCIWSHARQQRRTKDTGACANLDGTLPVSFRHSAASLTLALSSCAGACVRLVAL
jgi:hypothetical protein